MKKIVSAFILSAMLLGLAACASTTPKSESFPGDTMTVKEVMDSILTDVENLPSLGEIELTADNFEYYTFVSSIDGAEGLVSEPMIGSIPHSVVLVRVLEGTDAEATAKSIEENANPRKWICVEAEKVSVAVHGSTILLVMSDTATADSITANFDSLWK